MQETAANTGELECFAWDVIRKNFYTDLTVKKSFVKRQSFVIPFIANVRN